MTNTSKQVAYDLSLFEEVHRRPKLEEVKLPKKKQNPGISPLKTIGASLIIVALLGVFVYSNAMLTEAVADINAANAQLNSLQGEYSRLTVELNRKTSMNTIEEYATEVLNMSRAESYQMEYVNIATEDDISVTPSQEGSSNFFNGLLSLFRTK